MTDDERRAKLAYLVDWGKAGGLAAEQVGLHYAMSMMADLQLDADDAVRGDVANALRLAFKDGLAFAELWDGVTEQPGASSL